MIFAASSLKPALDALFADQDVALNYAGSGLLARQIGAGAPAGVFISANPAWMDQIEGLTVPGTRRDLLGNRLVLVGQERVALADIPEGTPIVTGLVQAVPLGQYARQAMDALGVWERLSPSLVQVENARLATALVARGEVPFGIVYATDAMGSENVEVIAELPASAHAPIRYPMALIEARTQPLYDKLLSAEAAEVFTAHGFEVL